MKKVVVILLLLVMLISSSFRNKRERIIPLTHSNGLYFVKLNLNNKKGNFLVDTGAIVCLLDVSQSNRYTFRTKDIGAEFIGLGGRKKRYEVFDYLVKHDDAKLAIHFQGADISDLVDNFRDNHIEIVGIIGASYFKSVQATIDYKNNKLIVYEWD